MGLQVIQDYRETFKLELDADAQHFECISCSWPVLSCQIILRRRFGIEDAVLQDVKTKLGW